MKVSFLIGIVFFLVISCNKVENKPIEDYKVIETDHFIIKSKYKYHVRKELLENELLKELVEKDSLNHIILSTKNKNGILMFFDEVLINDTKKLEEIKTNYVKKMNLKPFTYSDTIINHKKIRFSELKTNSDFITIDAKISKSDNYCYIISLITSNKNYSEDKKYFVEILEQIKIKE